MAILCENCGRPAGGVFGKRCKYCGGYFCLNCIKPEKHNCPGVDKAIPPSEESITSGHRLADKVIWMMEGMSREIMSREKELPFPALSHAIESGEKELPHAIEPPFKELLIGEKRVIVPKLLFPYNEDYLKFALFQCLEEGGIRAFLEPKFRIIRQPRRVLDLLIGRPPYIASIRPDILVYDYNQIWEIENFWKKFEKLTEHAKDYEAELGLKSYTFTWLRKGLRMSSKLVLVNPVTGEITGPGDIREIAIPPPSDLKFLYVTWQDLEIPAGSLRVWIQYELFRWLRSRGFIVSVEINVGGQSGRVFAPDKIIVNCRSGIVTCIPDIFTPYKGWSYESTSSAVIREVPLRFDVVATLPEATDEIEIFEVKTIEDFNSEEKIRKVIRQITSYANMKLARRFWLVVPHELAFVKALKDVFMDSRIGLITYSYPREEISGCKRA